jgi:hypothetical protein
MKNYSRNKKSFQPVMVSVQIMGILGNISGKDAVKALKKAGWKGWN